MKSPYDDLDLLEDLETPVGGPKMGIVVAAVANFLVGALVLALAGMTIGTKRPPVAIQMLEEVMGSVKLDQAQTGRRRVQMEEPQTVDLLRYLRPVASGMTTMVGIPFGILCLVAGIGVVQRRAWGRLLSLVLGGMATLIALAAVPILDFPGVILYGSYALLTLIILRDKDYSRQFR